MSKIALFGLIALPTAFSFGWMGNMIGSDGSLPNSESELEKRQGSTMAGCPVNPIHTYGVPISFKFPYQGAYQGKVANNTVGNREVPADGDKAHVFSAPGKNDIRGPCPGLNTAANHNVYYTVSDILCSH